MVDNVQILEQPTSILEEGISFEDYLERYDGQRTEWHAGKVIQRMSNNPQHNLIMGFLYRLLVFFLEEQKLGTAIIDGVPMYISEEVPAREPDIMVLLNDSVERLDEKALRGAADICIEILSPSTAHIDRGAKFIEYEAAGVQEYWMIDPVRKLVDVYSLNEAGHYQPIDTTAGQLRSDLLVNFVLDKMILWQETLPAGMAMVALVQGMLDTE